MQGGGKRPKPPPSAVSVKYQFQCISAITARERQETEEKAVCCEGNRSKWRIFSVCRFQPLSIIQAPLSREQRGIEGRKRGEEGGISMPTNEAAVRPEGQSVMLFPFPADPDLQF